MAVSSILVISDAATGEEVASLLDSPDVRMVATGQHWREALLQALRVCRRATRNEVRKVALANAIEQVSSSSCPALVVRRARVGVVPSRT